MPFMWLSHKAYSSYAVQSTTVPEMRCNNDKGVVFAMPDAHAAILTDHIGSHYATHAFYLVDHAFDEWLLSLIDEPKRGDVVKFRVSVEFVDG